MTRTAISPVKTMNRMIAIEVSATTAPDCRRVVNNDRQALQVALRSGDPERIRGAHAEALNTLALWGL
jgi:hypothetical protein